MEQRWHQIAVSAEETADFLLVLFTEYLLHHQSCNSFKPAPSVDYSSFGGMRYYYRDSFACGQNSWRNRAIFRSRSSGDRDLKIVNLLTLREDLREIGIAQKTLEIVVLRNLPLVSGIEFNRFS